MRKYQKVIPPMTFGIKTIIFYLQPQYHQTASYNIKSFSHTHICIYNINIRLVFNLLMVNPLLDLSLLLFIFSMTQIGFTLILS